MWNNQNPYGGNPTQMGVGGGNSFGGNPYGGSPNPPPGGNPYGGGGYGGGGPSLGPPPGGNSYGAPSGNPYGGGGYAPPSGNPYGGAPSMGPPPGGNPYGGGPSMGPPPGGNPYGGGGYGAPAGNYGAPPQGNYGAPPQGGGYGGGGYGAPPQGNYGAPPQGGYGGNYGAPPPGNYGAPPQQGYGQPQAAYRAEAGRGNKKAVLIGINYLRHQRGRLKGCINDVKNMEGFLQQRGFNSANMRVLTDDLQDSSRQPTKANILRDLRWLVQGAQPGDSLFFHFSGHGSQVVDTSGDEEDGMDETILPVDYNTAGQIIDDLLYEILVDPLPAGCKLTSLMDCCHSGTGLDLPYVHNLPSFSGQAQKKKKKKIKKKKSKKVKKQGELPGTSAADVMLYSGCRDDQTSADTSVGGEATGAMTWAFTSAFKKNPNLTYFGVLEAMRDALNSSGRYTQVPQLSTGRPMDLNQPFSL